MHHHSKFALLSLLVGATLFGCNKSPSETFILARAAEDVPQLVEITSSGHQTLENYRELKDSVESAIALAKANRPSLVILYSTGWGGLLLHVISERQGEAAVKVLGKMQQIVPGPSTGRFTLQSGIVTLPEQRAKELIESAQATMSVSGMYQTTKFVTDGPEVLVWKFDNQGEVCQFFQGAMELTFVEDFLEWVYKNPDIFDQSLEQ
jgi:hypothetical protein